jgi:hypothetical protein
MAAHMMYEYENLIMFTYYEIYYDVLFVYINIKQTGKLRLQNGKHHCHTPHLLKY